MNGNADDDPWVVPIEEAIDLHPFAPRDVVAVVGDYLDAAHARGFREVRLIHGRGKGVQRAAVHRLLASHPLVRRFRDAPESHLGATLVELVGDPPGRAPARP
ncbi:MAG: Smr/MutS family protein [Acidobacteria bacterium]|nr:Smr/MutS family protein [Acidobacteriota bacterium]